MNLWIISDSVSSGDGDGVDNMLDSGVDGKYWGYNVPLHPKCDARDFHSGKAYDDGHIHDEHVPAWKSNLYQDPWSKTIGYEYRYSPKIDCFSFTLNFLQNSNFGIILIKRRSLSKTIVALFLESDKFTVNFDNILYEKNGHQFDCVVHLPEESSMFMACKWAMMMDWCREGMF